VEALQRVQTEEEFEEVLQADRAALFFFGKWSVDAVHAQTLVAGWVRESQPPFPVFLVDPDEQPSARRWLERQGRDTVYHPYQRRGAVVWLRRGKIVAETTNPTPGGLRELQRLTAQAFCRP
jgi:hypothetical protein